MSHDTALSPNELTSYRAYVGRRMEERDAVSPEVVARIAAVLDQDWPAADGALPPMWHYGLFLTQTPTAKLGPDGHSPRGDFMPPVKLPRRMFAGATVRFHAPLVTGHDATKLSEIASVDYRQGKSGGLLFVRVKMTIVQKGVPCIEDEQTIVYRGAGARMAAIVPRALPEPSDGETAEDWTPGSVELFRYSTMIFNAHRIHYDLAYVTETEGYPGLVVHGPLTASRLCNFAGRLMGPLKQFRFRGEAPLFADQPIRLIAKAEGPECHLKAMRCDGAVAMTAVATI